MVTLHEGKHYIVNNDHIATAEEAAKLSAEEGKKQTLTYQVLEDVYKRQERAPLLCRFKRVYREESSGSAPG